MSSNHRSFDKVEKVTHAHIVDLAGGPILRCFSLEIYIQQTTCKKSFKQVSNFNMDCSKFNRNGQRILWIYHRGDMKKNHWEKIYQQFWRCLTFNQWFGIRTNFRKLGRLFDFGSKTHCEEDAWNRQWEPNRRWSSRGLRFSDSTSIGRIPESFRKVG